MKQCDLYNDDALKIMKGMRDGSVSLILTDPPYNIGVKTEINGKKTRNDWDHIENYAQWCAEWMEECARVLKQEGVMYIWHNNIGDISDILRTADEKCGMQLVSFCIWDKGEAYRAQSWIDRKPGALRSWFNRCEYCMHFVKSKGVRSPTGWERVDSNPASYREIKERYFGEKRRLGLSNKDIAEEYTKRTGKKAGMLRHYFADSQFELPTEAVWNAVYVPLGFEKRYEDLRKEYEDLRKEYEDLRKEYEESRYTHNCDAEHSNVWRVPPVPSAGRKHTCQKPLEILERIVRVSSKPGDVVFDPFMGSGSTGIASLRNDRGFIGIERDPKYFMAAKEWIENDITQLPLAIEGEQTNAENNAPDRRASDLRGAVRDAGSV